MSLLSLNLQAFLAVFEASTVSAAAVRLGIGQTGVTQRIKALEKELDVSLFLRSRKGMTLTTEGESLLKYCLRARELEGETLSSLKGTGEQSDIELTIAGPTSCLSGRVVPQTQFCFKKWPKLGLHFRVDDRENRLDLIKRGRADIVILHPHQVPAELDSKVIKPDEYSLVGHPDWRGRSMRDILENERLFAFHSDDQTSLNYLKTFELLSHLKRPRLFANENRALCQLFVDGVGFGILSREIAEPFLRDGLLIKLNQGRAMKDPLALAWFPRAEMPAYFKDLVRAIK
jgi:DNA-binding transcriptional LysR family regulator